jgi:hypothetical protein
MRQRLITSLGVFHTPGAWPAIWCVVAAAIYGCVPETDQMPTIGVLVGVVFAFEVVTRRQLAPVIHVGVAGVVLWSGLYGAAGQERAIAGTLFAFWPAAIVPLMAIAWPPLLRRPEPVRWTIAACGGAAALIVSRTGALDPGWAPALRSVAIWGPLSLIAAAVLVALTDRAARRT